MAETTRLTGENLKIKIDGTLYPVKGDIGINAPPRIVDMRAGGDAAPQPKQIGMDGGANATWSMLSTDEVLSSTNGKYVTAIVMDGSTTVETLEGILALKWTGRTAGEISWDADLKLGALPTNLGANLTI